MSDSKDIWLSVVLIVPNHSITGELNLGDLRLSDVLNDVRCSFIELHNTAFSRLSDPGKVISRTTRTSIPKDKVVIAFELTKDRAPNSKRFFSYREKRKYSVFLATEDMEVRGFLHATPKEGPLDLSVMKERWFIPLTKAMVSFCTISDYNIRQDAILVNLHAIQYFSVGDAIDTDK